MILVFGGTTEGRKAIKEIEEELIKRSKKINNFKGERKNIEKL